MVRTSEAGVVSVVELILLLNMSCHILCLLSKRQQANLTKIALQWTMGVIGLFKWNFVPLFEKKFPLVQFSGDSTSKEIDDMGSDSVSSSEESDMDNESDGGEVQSNLK